MPMMKSLNLLSDKLVCVNLFCFGLVPVYLHVEFTLGSCIHKKIVPSITLPEAI